MSETNNSTETYNPNGGPRTEAGRATSSRNALKHGCCSEATLILQHENIADYKALEATWFNAYQPREEGEVRLVRKLIDADWFLDRINRTVAEVESQMYLCSPLEWTDHQHQKLGRFLRYQTARTNLVTKARKAVEDYRKNRSAEVVKAEKHEIYKEKSKPEPTVEEIIAQLKQDKINKDRAEAEAQLTRK